MRKRIGIITLMLILVSSIAGAQANISLNGELDYTIRIPKNKDEKIIFTNFSLPVVAFEISGYFAERFYAGFGFDVANGIIPVYGSWLPTKSIALTFGMMPIDYASEIYDGVFGYELGVRWKQTFNEIFSYSIILGTGAPNNALASYLDMSLLALTKEEEYPNALIALTLTPGTVFSMRLAGRASLFKAYNATQTQYGANVYLGVKQPLGGINFYVEAGYDWFDVSSSHMRLGVSALALEADLRYSILGVVAPGVTYEYYDYHTTMELPLLNQKVMESPEIERNRIVGSIAITPIEEALFVIRPYVGYDVRSSSTEKIDFGFKVEWERAFSFYPI